MLLFSFIPGTLYSCAQSTTTMKNESPEKNNASLLCEIETGVCSPADTLSEKITVAPQRRARLIYYTDPICSACWAIEPNLRRFKLEYGAYVDIEYRMGGLLPGWEGFADKANGIRKPSDVAHHWDEVGEQSGMSIDGDVWLEDPLESSYPPSIAYYAVKMQDEQKALQFLRLIRQFVFLEKKNICRDAYLLEAAQQVGADTALFSLHYKNGSAKALFDSDMQERSAFGVRGFPTFVFLNTEGQGYKISGSSSYTHYVETLAKVYEGTLRPAPIDYTPVQLLQHYGMLSTAEIAVLIGLESGETEILLQELASRRQLIAHRQKYGWFWKAVR